MSDAFEAAVNKEFVSEHRLAWRIHLFVYGAVNTLLVAIWWFTSDGGEVMPWFIFSLIGWGIGLGAHYMAYRTKRSALPPV